MNTIVAVGVLAFAALSGAAGFYFGRAQHQCEGVDPPNPVAVAPEAITLASVLMADDVTKRGAVGTYRQLCEAAGGGMSGTEACVALEGTKTPGRVER